MRISATRTHSYFVQLAILLVVVSAFVCLAGDDGAEARYVGGTIAGLDEAKGSLRTSDDLFLEFRCKGRQMHVPYDQINLLEYGLNVNRRLALAIVISPMFLLSKSRKHFLTVGYTDEKGKQQAMVFQIEKGKVRPVLVSLEARTGRKIQFQDDEARKAGKG